MNLKYIFDTQIKLDEEISNSLINPSNVDKKRVIALLVELGEFANEVMTFKYWKKQIKINHESMLEEFADGIHFLTSIAYRNHLNPEIPVIIKHTDFNIQLIFTYQCFTKLFKSEKKSNIKKAYGAYLGLGEIMKISYNDIIESYNKKNQKNFERIKNNY
ncbi:hypothetical protein HGG64_00740 [Mycoplasma phocoeninasale]|uniref:dUTP diphosphatase n=1 Tax=Mycoplasma phocoeninasale TaxID=2726117 RepID=A0A858U1F3_9MOLU|nr:dUTP diphosphatase [Mycoplasma phocoeninasale]QJG66242.1 hypothetical protein HGG64_00740 [Mycoplasma phocoeninasale]